jgi:AP-1 complex subunit beta-1
VYFVIFFNNLFYCSIFALLQDSDNPDLRDRGYIYWRLLSTDPAAAKEVVLAEKPLISEETDLLEPTLLDELICHISSLASVYHKPPNAFVEGRGGVPVRRVLPPRSLVDFMNFLSLILSFKIMI